MPLTEYQAMLTRLLSRNRTFETFVESRPVEELGCLYYGPSSRAFVDPRGVRDAVPHFGRPGGVLPRFADST